MKRILWILFVFTGFYMGLQSDILVRATPQKYRVFQLEFASRAQGKQILHAWNDIPFSGKTLLQVAVNHTWLNDLLLVLFTSLLLLYSYLQMQHEKWLRLNELLRFNLLLTIGILLLGVEENYLTNTWRWRANTTANTTRSCYLRSAACISWPPGPT